METIGRYELIEEIGSGGMGVVYRALDTELDHEVALKLLPQQLNSHDRFAALFQREGNLVANLQHPHIVPVYVVGIEDKRPYLAMRLLRGGTLRDKFNQGKMPLLHLWDYMLQIAQALDAAHHHGVIHRDIKPTNILFDEKGSAVISDFGLAKTIDGSISSTGSSLIGTPAYMSPEQCLDTPLDGRSDQYGLAVVIFEALTGKLPFTGEPLQLMYKHVNVLPPDVHTLNKDIPVSISAVLKKALAKSPTERFNSVTEFVVALQSATPANLTNLPLPIDGKIEPQTPRETAVASTPTNRQYKTSSPMPPSAPPPNSPPQKAPIIIGAGGGTLVTTTTQNKRWAIFLLGVLLISLPIIAITFWPQPLTQPVINPTSTPTAIVSTYTLTITKAISSASWQLDSETMHIPTTGHLHIPSTSNTAVIQSGTGKMELLLPNHITLHIAQNSILLLRPSNPLTIILQQGQLLIQTPTPFSITNPFGAKAEINNGLLGIMFSQSPFRFDADCFVGNCALIGDIQGEQELTSEQHSYVGGVGSPSQPDAVRYDLYTLLADIIPTTTATAISSSTPNPTTTTQPTPTATKQSTSTPQPTATKTATPKPIATTTYTPTPVVVPTNTPLPPTIPPTSAPEPTSPPAQPPTDTPPPAQPPTEAPPPP